MLVAFDFFSRLRGKSWTGDAGAVARVRAMLKTLAGESDGRIRERGEALRGRFDTVEAVALVTESVRRAHGLEAYDVQLLAGLALAEGRLVEMATGEGKTLAALLPAYCFALRGRGAHVATVNAYLAARDAEFARPVFERLGLTVGLLRDRESRTAKRAAYASDVTYGVGTEFGFDYLRDQLAIRSAGRTEPSYHEIFLRRLPPQPALVQRGCAFAVIDEADSVLLDEARSPLIISTSAPRPSTTPGIYRLADEVAAGLQEAKHYARDPETGRYLLTDEGERHALDQLNDAALAQLRRVWTHYLENALHARWGVRRDVHYIIMEGRVTIVDEFTGRLCPDRTWRDGLHQAVEARTGVAVTEENSSEATISRPAYFRLYERVAGLSGTIAEAAGELRESYEMATVVVPLNRRCQRVLLPDRVFATRAVKHAAAVREIAARHGRGQPVLVGTRTIENSEALMQALAPLGLKVRLLNARQDAEEARIIASAGEPGAITIATNMAGRGAHIPVPAASLKAGGLHVLGLERHESARIDRQLIGRGARQGQPGSAQFFLSLEDDLLVRHAAKLLDGLSRRATADGELPARTAALFQKTQRKVEADDRAQRRVLAHHHRWLNELKQAL